MWGNYSYQAFGQNSPNNPVMSQGSQSVGPMSQPGTSAPDSFSNSRKRKKSWNWPVIAIGLSCLGILGAIIVSKGRKKAKAIPPPETGKVEGREKVSTKDYKGFSSRKYRFDQALPDFKISEEAYDEVTRSYGRVRGIFRRITEKDNKKVFLVTGGV